MLTQILKKNLWMYQALNQEVCLPGLIDANQARRSMANIDNSIDYIEFRMTGSAAVQAFCVNAFGWELTVWHPTHINVFGVGVGVGVGVEGQFDGERTDCIGMLAYLVIFDGDPTGMKNCGKRRRAFERPALFSPPLSPPRHHWAGRTLAPCDGIRPLRRGSY